MGKASGNVTGRAGPVREYRHAEAFCIMDYVETQTVVDENGHVEIKVPDNPKRETLWNCRDGVTPFTLMSVDGEARLQHCGRDRRDPTHVPPVGSRVFMDMSLERARKFAAEVVEHLAEKARADGVVDSPGMDVLASLTADMWRGGESPDVVVVDKFLHEVFRALAAQRRRHMPPRKARQG